MPLNDGIRAYNARIQGWTTTTNTTSTTATNYWSGGYTVSYTTYNQLLESVYGAYHKPRYYQPTIRIAEAEFRALGEFNHFSTPTEVRLLSEGSKDGLIWYMNYTYYNLEEGLKRLYKNPPSKESIYELNERLKMRSLVVGDGTADFIKLLMEHVGKEYKDFVEYANDITLFFDEGRLSVFYLPRSKYGRCTPFEAKNARMMVTESVGKFIKKTLNLPDADVETLVDKAKVALLGGTVEFSLVRGDDIRQWYHHSRYSRKYDTGDLRNSCMRYDGCQDYFGIYTQNPQVEMLIATRNGELIGRTIIWTHENGTKYADRVYGSRMVQWVIKDWCKQNGIKSQEETRNVVIKLDNVEFKKYPYCDTMRYIDLKRKFVSYNPTVGGKRVTGYLQSTNGTLTYL